VNILLTGGTGFIGAHLVPELTSRDHELFILTRSQARAGKEKHNHITYLHWTGKADDLGWSMKAEGVNAVINLAGENVGSGLWTKAKKKRIEESRLGAGKALVQAISGWKTKPEQFIQCSATGYYGDRTEVVDEGATQGKGFLANLSKKWEASTAALEAAGVHRAVIRIGVVLGREGGVMRRLLLPFRLGLGGPVGSGRQGFPWVHIDDVIQSIVFLLEHAESGVFNLTAPQILTMREFTKNLADVLHRPHIVPVPAGLLKLVLGEMADEMLLSGARVFPRHLLDSGYNFRYNKINLALKDLI